MRCKKCGKKLRANEIFCSSCGYYNDPSDSSSEDLYKENNNDFSSEDDLLKDDDSFDDDIQIQATNFTDGKSTKKRNKFFDFQYDRFLEAYIGEDYKIVVRKKINIYAFFLNWMYFLYRKLYIIGIVGLIITGIVIKFFTNYFIYYIIIVMVLSGLLFNPIYLLVAKKRVLYIKRKSKYDDDFSIEQLCTKYGGVNFVVTLIIYAIFLIVMFLSMYDVVFPQKHSKFFKENSENEANCSSMIRRIYSLRSNLKIDGDVKEGVCNISTGTNKIYNIYIKAENNNGTYYLFYKTKENYLELQGNTQSIAELEQKVSDRNITAEEELFLNNSKNIESKYKSAKSMAKTEDILIKKNKATSEKLNYIITEKNIKR